MLQTFGFPSGGRQVNALGNFVRYRSANGRGLDETIRVRADGNDLGPMLPGDWVLLPINASRWEIVPSVAGVTGEITIGVGQAGSDALVGTVRVEDSSLDRTMEGRQFFHFNGVAAAVGQVSYAGILCNSAPFGVALRKVLVSSATGGPCLLGWGTGAGTTTVGLLNPNNKRLGNPVATARTCGGYAAGILPTAGEVPGWQLFAQVYVQANQTLELRFENPFVLTGTQCFLVNGGTANRDLLATFDFEELSA